MNLCAPVPNISPPWGTLKEADPPLPQDSAGFSPFPNLQGARFSRRGGGGERDVCVPVQRGPRLPRFLHSGPWEDAYSRGLEKGGEQFGVSELEGAYLGPAISHIPAPPLSSTTSEGPAMPSRGGLCVYSVGGRGVAGGCMSWGKGVTDFSF